MELTKEYFDEQLQRLATKEDLKVLRQQMEHYADEVGQSVIILIDFHFRETNQRFEKIDQRLDKIEKSLQLPQLDSYIVKDNPNEPYRYRAGDAEKMFIEIMAKRGRKWPPSKPS